MTVRMSRVLQRTGVSGLIEIGDVTVRTFGNLRWRNKEVIGSGK